MVRAGIMRFWISRKSDVPIRDQIATQILLAIYSGEFPTGSRIERGTSRLLGRREAEVEARPAPRYRYRDRQSDRQRALAPLSCPKRHFLHYCDTLARGARAIRRGVERSLTEIGHFPPQNPVVTLQEVSQLRLLPSGNSSILMMESLPSKRTERKGGIS